MKLDDCIIRINRYLNSNDLTPRLVNVKNCTDLAKISQNFKAGNIMLPVSQYAKFEKQDEIPQLDDLWDKLSNAQENVFVTGITTWLKLMGSDKLLSALGNFATSTFPAHVVILCYQCEQYLTNIPDIRANRLIYSVDSDYFSKIPKIVFTSPRLFSKLSKGDGTKSISGVENIAAAIETMDGGTLYVKSKKRKSNYSNSILMIEDEIDAFDVLCNIDPETGTLEKEYGTDEQWEFAFSKVALSASWKGMFQKEFGVSFKNLGIILESWKSFDDNKKWLYFIGLKLYGAGRDYWCINAASKNANNVDKLVQCIYRSILNIDPESPEFWDKYSSRKKTIKAFGYSDNDVITYLQLLPMKEEKGLYYLTDGSNREKDRIFELLDKYGQNFSREEIYELLSHIYPDLYNYLQPTYRFKNKGLDLNKYFQDYKYQKVINKIYPEFLEFVENQAAKREFNLYLPPRSGEVDALDKTGARLYFVDAMGVEYLSFILAQCKDLKLMANIQICHCKLPSITSENKEFLEGFENSCSVRRLDNIKHHGEESFDYTKTKLPTHLAAELEVVKDILKEIRDQLLSGEIIRAYIISDHGASRLAVINEHENQWEMASKGEHSGRCCKKNEADIKAEYKNKYVMETSNYWVLANYDRFKGGRKANVEVHGGATLEEVTVPIIEVTCVPGNIEVHIQSKLPILVSYRKDAELKIFSTSKLGEVIARVDGEKISGRYYEAEQQENNMYKFTMPDIKDVGNYSITVFSNNNEVAKLPFTVKKEGSSERKMF